MLQLKFRQDEQQSLVSAFSIGVLDGGFGSLSLSVTWRYRTGLPRKVADLVQAHGPADWVNSGRHERKIDLMEIWMPCPGFEKNYSVSSEGRVRRETDSSRRTAGVILKPSFSGRYASVSLRNNQKVIKRPMVHRLTAIAFYGNPPVGYEVNHKNGLRFDNRAENLEWVTHSQNQKEACRLGLATHPPINTSNAKITYEQAEEIRRQAAGGEKRSALGTAYGLRPTTINAIIYRQIWRRPVAI